MKSLYQIQEELKNKGELFMDKSKEYYEYIKEKYKNENLSLGELLYYEVLDDLQGKDSILNKEEN